MSKQIVKSFSSSHEAELAEQIQEFAIHNELVIEDIAIAVNSTTSKFSTGVDVIHVAVVIFNQDDISNKINTVIQELQSNNNTYNFLDLLVNYIKNRI